MNTYAGPIVDPHHHLWDLSLGRHAWLADSAGTVGGLGDLAPIRRNYLPADYRHDAAHQNIVATVHIEAKWDPDDCLGETQWLETLPDKRGVASRIVAHVPLASPTAAALLEVQASSPRVVGIRDILSFHDDPARRFATRGDWMSDPAWRAGLARLARHGLSFDLMIFPQQLAAAARLADDFAGLQFILNHGGSPTDRDEAGMARWRSGMSELGRRPNVAVKISDLVAYDPHWTPDSIRPIVMHCIESFGVERAMFGSDFPVAALHASFDDVYETFKAIVADLSASEQALLFHGNAARFYRLDGEVSPPARLPA